ncbi:tyrosine-type recombinase/integrase [Alysiella crassa]|nr:tyrosine-type recombinase/integrase [Alysiella crassa]UOP05900.1 tyrosine-type recombinase/integrase [Alysiella crassa]
MGSIIKRKNPSGEIVYRAQIRIQKIGYPNFSESRTFSKRILAVAWLKRREAEIEANPDILLDGKRKSEVFPTLREAIQRYNQEHEGQFGRTKSSTLEFMANFPIGDIRLNRLRRSDIAEFAILRRNGQPEKGILAVKGATVEHDLHHLRALIKHAYFVWGLAVDWQNLDMAIEGLRRSRLISRADERTRLPTRDELLQLTAYFYQSWQKHWGRCKYPMHLIIWFAIYSCRREGEICRLEWADFDREHQEWLVRDMKHPRGSKGNHHTFLVRDDTLTVIDTLASSEIRGRMAKLGLSPDYLIGGDPRAISKAFTTACKTLNIQDLCFHDLRHEGATRLAENGLTVPQMQQITLHQNWKTLQRYVNMATRPRPNRLDFDEAMAFAMAQK